jgi:hypothetical protein
MTGISKWMELCRLLTEIFTGYSRHDPSCDIYQTTFEGKPLACSCGYDDLVKKINKLRGTM